MDIIRWLVKVFLIFLLAFIIWLLFNALLKFPNLTYFEIALICAIAAIGPWSFPAFTRL